MAKKWCLEYGVLKWADAEALCKELGISIVRRPLDSSLSLSLCVRLSAVADDLSSCLGQNVTRPSKSPTSANGKAGKKSRASAGGARRAASDAAIAEELGLSGAGFEGVGIGSL